MPRQCLLQYSHQCRCGMEEPMSDQAVASANGERAAPLLDLREVVHWYGTFQALKGITCQLPPGRIGLLGPNGAGKSTLLKILLGLLPPSSGSGRVLDQNIGSSGGDLRRAIGYMPEADA